MEMAATEISPLLDSIALALLAELEQDARLSFAELGRRVGLSPSAAAERVKRLEEAGVIRGYRADIDPASIGLGIMAIVRMSCDGEQYRRFLAFVNGCEQIYECHHVTGADALTLVVRVASIEELEGLVMKLLKYGIPTTSIVLSSPLARRHLPLAPKRVKA